MIKLFLILMLSFVLAGMASAAVNINTASQAELESLQGIGPAKAKAIIAYREEKGSFASVDDLKNVDGIGPGILKQIRDQVTVEGSSSAAAPAPATNASAKQ